MTDKNGSRIAPANRLNHLVDMTFEIGSIRRLVIQPRQSERLNFVAFA